MVTIEVKKGKDPNLKRPTFLCDKCLKENVPNPYNILVEGYKFVLWIGRPQSGKTSHLFSLFRDKRIFRKVWYNIIVVMPQASLNSIASKDNIFADIDQDKIYTDLQDIDRIRDQVMLYAEQGENTAIIIDDQMTSLKNKFVEAVLTDIISNRRHYRCHIFILSQLYERVPLKIRKLVNDVFVMYKPSKKETELIFDELLEQDKNTAEQVHKLAFTKPYDWLMIDVPSQKLYSNYNELIIHED